MPTRLRKARRYRGSRTHGWGQIGQHRHSGSKGGSGMAGLHKHKWSYLVKYAPDHFGRNRFRPPNTIRKYRWLNLHDLPRVVQSTDGPVDLGLMGYQKLLGAGTVSVAYKLKIPQASASAREKVQAAGGNVEIESSQEEASRSPQAKKKA